jgi:cytidine deaminase
MAAPDDATLMRAALDARRFAVAPYSRFQVGAALLAEDGTLFPGANVESASYGLTCCAERVALFRALTSGARGFRAIAITARIDGGPMPCGACRQLLAEYAPGARVLVADAADPAHLRHFVVEDLLPGAFLDVPENSH